MKRIRFGGDVGDVGGGGGDVRGVGDVRGGGDVRGVGDVGGGGDGVYICWTPFLSGWRASDSDNKCSAQTVMTH